ncbi:MAG: GldG family protein [Spirochaetales bacterium]|nr:GldG family protein [Spirochaetales bacterium]
MNTYLAKSLRFLLTLLPLIIGVLILGISGRAYGRFDLTRDKIYSLSPVTLEIIEQLSDPIEVRYYLSARLEQEVPEVQLIRDLLQEMARANPQFLTFRVINPENDRTQTPEDLGIAPQQYQVVEENEQRITTVYTGLVITYRDDFMALPLVIDPQSLEYEVLRAIKGLTATDTALRRIGVLFGDSSLAQSSQVLLSSLDSLAEVSVLSPGEDFPPGLTGLLIFGQRELTGSDFERISNHMSQGRSALFAFDYHRVILAQGLEAIEGVSTPGIEFLSSLGVELLPEWVLDTQNRPIPIQQAQGRVLVSSLEPYDLWPRASGLSGEFGHPTMNRIGGIDLFWASPLVVSSNGLLDPEGFSPLFSASQNARIMVPPLTLDPRALPIGDPVIDEPPVLGISYEGTLGNSGEVRAVFIGDQDVFSDLLQINQSDDNLIFLQNVVEWLLRDDDLLLIRSKQPRNTSLEIGDSTELRAFWASVVRILGIVLGPALFIFLGLFVWLGRRSGA